MKKFKYRLQSYLRFLEHKKNEALKDFKISEAKKISLEREQKQMELRMKKAYNLNTELGKSISDVHLVNDNNQFILLLKEQMKELSTEIMFAEEEYQKKYTTLVELKSEAEKIKKHKEDQGEIHKKALKKHQQKMSDELNSRRSRGLYAKSDG